MSGVSQSNVWSDFFTKYSDRIMPEPNSGCLLWSGSWTTAGYGNLTRWSKTWYAHQAAFHCVNGYIPSNGHEIRHTCDVPCCVNPSHLIPGTRLDNVNDMIERGRQNHVFGESCPVSKLSDADVIALRASVASGETPRAASVRLKVEMTTIYSAIYGLSWAHISEPLSKRGRAKGTAVWNSKLNEEIVRLIRSDSRTPTEIAKAYGLRQSKVWDIVNYKSWKHVT